MKTIIDNIDQELQDIDSLPDLSDVYVTGHVYLDVNPGLKSLSRSSKIVRANSCGFLVGSPRRVRDDFSVSSGHVAPEYVGGNFYCGIKFSEADVRSICRVEGLVLV